MKAWTIQADFRSADEYQTIIERAQQMAGSLDILVNNASIFPTDTLADLNWSGLSANIEVNAWILLVLGRAFAQQIAAARSSTCMIPALKGYSWTHVGYILSKHVLAEMTRMMALEFAPHIASMLLRQG